MHGKSDITELNAEFNKQEIDMPVGLKLDYEGGGREIDKIIVKESSQGLGARVILIIEWIQTDSKWVIKNNPSEKIVSSINGRENYDEISKEIGKHVRENY